MDCQAFVEVIGMFDQDALDVLWFVEQDAGERPKMHAADVALARHMQKKAQAIFAKFGQIPDKRVSTNVTKRFLIVFWVMYFCLDLSCHGMFLIDLAGVL
jgi:hypothetical protein